MGGEAGCKKQKLKQNENECITAPTPAKPLAPVNASRLPCHGLVDQKYVHFFGAVDAYHQGFFYIGGATGAGG